MTMLMSMCLIVPIGPIISLLKTWFGSARHKLLKAKNELTYPAEEPQLFKFKDAERLPFPENEAIAHARVKITEGEFEQAKEILTTAWIQCSTRESAEIPRSSIRAAIAELYEAQGDAERAIALAQMPLLILDSEINWSIAHPNDPIGRNFAEGSRAD